MKAWLGVVLAAAVGFAGALSPAASDDDALARWIAGPQRSAGNRDRDGARHPYETLRFFGLTDRQTVVEILPGGVRAYWTEILAPYLRDRGKYIAALNDDDTNRETQILNPGF